MGVEKDCKAFIISNQSMYYLYINLYTYMLDGSIKKGKF